MLVLVAAMAAVATALPSHPRPPPNANIAHLNALAELVSAAYCPTELLSTTRAPQTPLSPSHPQVSPDVIKSSEDPAFDDWLDGAPDMSWYITHSDNVLTLAFSSLPTTDEVLELLSDDVGTAPIPHNLAEHEEHVPHVHAHLIPTLQSHGIAAFNAVLDVLASISPSSHWVDALDAELGEYEPALRQTTIEVIGHGWGAATALVVSAAIWNELPNRSMDFDMQGTFFGLPAIGDEGFADWIDTTLDADRYTTLKLVRASNGRDPIALIPPSHTGFRHPRIAEVLVGERGKSLGESVVEDHWFFGNVPFAGTCVL